MSEPNAVFRTCRLVQAHIKPRSVAAVSRRRKYTHLGLGL